MAVGTLIKLGGNLEQPRDSKPSDYPAVGPSGPTGEMEPGEGKLVKLSMNQEGPRHTQDSGENTPSKWGSDGGFTVSKAKSQSTSVKCDWSVDLSSGQVSPNVASSKY